MKIILDMKIINKLIMNIILQHRAATLNVFEQVINKMDCYVPAHTSFYFHV